MKKKSILVSFFCSLLLLVLHFFMVSCTSSPKIEPRPASEPDIYNCINHVKSLLPARASIPDINRDGLNDYIDVALSFKVFWDSIYTYRCEIVRNKTPDKLHHLFVRVWNPKNCTWIYVEPKSSVRSYDMQIVWGDKYDPAYNFYNETYRWMKEIVYGKCKN